MRINRLSVIILCVIVCIFTTSCNQELVSYNDTGKIKIGMVTDTGGINDQSFNQISWDGFKALSSKYDIEVRYIESKQDTDYETNFDMLADSNFDLIWATGFALSDAILQVAKNNPDINYAIVDSAFENQNPDNVTSVLFKSQEPAFVVGYIAGRTTKTNKVGFLGGMVGNIIDQFQYGYQAGVDFAARELNKEISVSVQYAESFSDAAKGKAIGTKMYSDGCDIVFSAAGGVGIGLIESAKNLNKFAIGVDLDQAYLAPNNVLTSALKKVDKATFLVSEEFYQDKNIGGKTYIYGFKEDAVGIPEHHENMNEDVYNDAIALGKRIANGEIIPPYNLETYQQYKLSL